MKSMKTILIIHRLENKIEEQKNVLKQYENDNRPEILGVKNKVNNSIIKKEKLIKKLRNNGTELGWVEFCKKHKLKNY